MSSNFFQFKQFKIAHDKSTMKVGTDGVLVGAWAKMEYSKNILDIGSGSGLIALIAAQKNNLASISAVEPDQSSYTQAIQNVKNSNWSDRIDIYHSRIQDFKPGIYFDTIVSNPPFFKTGNRSSENARDMARSAIHLPPLKLIESVTRLLNRDGYFSMIYPVDEGKEFIDQALRNGLFLSRQTTVRSRMEMPPERLLLEFSRRNINPKFSDLAIYQSGKNKYDYTADYVSITKDFYLYM